MTVAIPSKNQNATQVINSDYWRVYHSKETLERADALITTYMISSTGVNLHIDAYEQPHKNAPVIIFNHGGGGYSRLFVPLALELYDSGYTVVLPDQRGQGLSEGVRGDFVLPQLVRNIVDATQWARQKYAGKLFMAGASQGGALTYYAVAAGAPVAAMICHNLYDFGNPKNIMAAARFSALRNIYGFPSLFELILKMGATLLPQLHLNVNLLSRFDKMVDERAVGFLEKYMKDPYPIRAFNLRYLASTFTTPPAVPLEENAMPVLVINQSRDEMVSPKATLVNYERLGGDKQYVEIDYGHWAIGGGFEQEWVALADGFFKQFM